MGAIGPTLPPHLAGKRRRSESESSEDGPAPQLPNHGLANDRQSEEASEKPEMSQNARSSGSSERETKLRRVIGPSLPPASLDELPPDAVPSTIEAEEHVESDNSDSDDLGPAPPPADGTPTSNMSWADVQRPEEAVPNASKPLQREEWMLAPPSGGDWSQSVDPTKLKNRKFNTMKGAKAAPRENSGASNLWTETPEQKRKRLEDEMMGIRPAGNSGSNSSSTGSKRVTSRKDEQVTERKLREYNEAHRGSETLLEKHRTKAKKQGKDIEDDPSKRSFDRDKDVGGGAFSSVERRQLLDRAKDMGSRFEKARYL